MPVPAPLRDAAAVPMSMDMIVPVIVAMTMPVGRAVVVRPTEIVRRGVAMIGAMIVALRPARARVRRGVGGGAIERSQRERGGGCRHWDVIT